MKKQPDFNIEDIKKVCNAILKEPIRERFDETRCKFIKAEDEELQITIRKPKFKMFDKLEDSVSGFRGQVLCITFFATGCIKYSIAPNILTKDGTRYEWNNIDESLLVCKEESKKEKAT